jgi:opacity protein-like surface antigen
MKKFLILVGLIASTCAFAQADKFSGFSVGLNTGFATNTFTFDDGTDKSTAGATNTPIDITASYTMSLSSNATIGFGVAYDLYTPKFLKSSDFGGDNATEDVKLNNHYSVFIEPGVALSETTLGYFKLAYHAGTAKTTDLSKNVNGTGYGFGARHFVNNNMYLNIEIQQVNYSKITVSSTDLSGTQNLATVGIGYKF